MAKPLVDDELWQLIQPLLPPPKPRRWRYPRRKPLTNRQGADRNPVLPEERHPLGNVAQGNGMRLGHELLAPPSGLAGSRGLAEAS